MYLSKSLLIKSKIAKLFDKLYIPDNTCLSCGNYFLPSYQGYVCDDCISSIKIGLFEKPSIDYVDAYQIFSSYDEALKHMIKALKFQKAKVFADIIADIIKEDFTHFVRTTNPDIISFVPISFFRLLERGYNQDTLILKALKLNPENILRRTKHHKPLSLSASKDQRLKIVSKAFDVRKEYKFKLDNKSVLIFDDIITTGATSSSIAKVLKFYGVSKVYFYFLASHRKEVVV